MSYAASFGFGSRKIRYFIHCIDFQPPPPIRARWRRLLLLPDGRVRHLPSGRGRPRGVLPGETGAEGISATSQFAERECLEANQILECHGCCLMPSYMSKETKRQL